MLLFELMQKSVPPLWNQWLLLLVPMLHLKAHLATIRVSLLLVLGLATLKPEPCLSNLKTAADPIIKLGKQ